MLLAFSLIVFFIVCYLYAELNHVFSKLPCLKDVAIEDTQQSISKDMVSIIMAGRNESERIKNAVESALNQDHAKLEVIVVDDDSNDNTPTILLELKQNYPALKIITVKELPDAWLGKNHAMYQGALAARGKWLLFADADVTLAPETVSLALQFLDSSGYSNLTLIPEIESKGFWLNLVITAGAIAFYYERKPWLAKEHNQKYSAGVGAFNMMRKNDYFAFGGHQAFPLNIVDDLKLGEILKAQGVEQICLDGLYKVKVQWYSSLKNMIIGIEKNSFAYCQYQISTLLKKTIISIMLFISPFWLLLSHNHTVQGISLVTILVTICIYYRYAKLKELALWQGILYPFAIIIGLWISWRAAILAKYRNAIIWRDRSYPLSLLKKHLG